MRYLVTGGSSGIGRQICLDLANRGHQVVCCGRDEGKLEEVRNLAPEGIIPLPFDVTSIEECRAALAEQLPFDVAVLNAGTCEYLDAQAFDGEVFSRVVATNLLGVTNCIDAVLSKIQPGGRLALMGSSASYLPLPRAEAYGASKAAVQYLARTLEITLAPQNIAVSYIAPGFVRTPLTDLNDFPMPMRIEVEEASAAIIAGLESGRSEIHFPKKFTRWLKLVAALPWSLQRGLITKLVSKQA